MGLLVLSEGRRANLAANTRARGHGQPSREGHLGLQRQRRRTIRSRTSPPRGPPRATMPRRGRGRPRPPAALILASERREARTEPALMHIRDVHDHRGL
jgi:hypothetical protein